MAVIVVVGAGAIGRFYAAQLILAGHDVRFLLRRGDDPLLREGLIVRQTPTDQIASTLTHPLLVLPPARYRACLDARQAASGAPPDLVLIGLKTTALRTLAGTLPPLLFPRTRLLATCNGLGIEEDLAALPGVRAEQVFGMLCFICVVRDANGHVEHQAHGKIGLGSLVPGIAIDGLAHLWASAGVVYVTPPSLREARWRKLVWNIPFNGLCLLHDCATDAVLADPQLRQRAARLMDETITVANADLAAGDPTATSSSRLGPDWAEAQFARTPEMGAYLPSTLLDARAGRELETDTLFQRPSDRARALGLTCPELTRLADESRALRDQLALRGLVSRAGLPGQPPSAADAHRH